MSDIGPPEPSWNPDVHLAGVYRRGRRLRTRRRVGVVAGGSLVVAALLAVGVALGVGAGGADHGRRVATGASGTSATAATTGPSGPSGPSGPRVGSASPGGSGGDGAGAGGAGSPSTVDARPGPPGAGGGVTPTSAPHHVTTNTTSATTIPGARTTTTQAATTTTGPAADCGPSDLAYSTVTNRSSYALGDAVDISLVLRNVSGRTCTAPSIAGIGAKATITGSGSPVTTTGPAIACTATCASPVLAPGQSAAYSAGSWDSTAARDVSGRRQPARKNRVRGVVQSGLTQSPGSGFPLSRPPWWRRWAGRAPARSPARCSAPPWLRVPKGSRRARPVWPGPVLACGR